MTRIKDKDLSLFSKNTVASKCSRDALESCAEHGEICVFVGFHV